MLSFERKKDLLKIKFVVVIRVFFFKNFGFCFFGLCFLFFLINLEQYFLNLITLLVIHSFSESVFNFILTILSITLIILFLLSFVDLFFSLSFDFVFIISSS